jgi:hypothetical protein
MIIIITNEQRIRELLNMDKEEQVINIPPSRNRRWNDKILKTLKIKDTPKWWQKIKEFCIPNYNILKKD